MVTYFRGHKRAFLEGYLMPWKRPIKSLMTIFTLAICFYIPLLLWTLWLNYDELKSTWRDQGNIAIFLSSQIDLKESGILLQEIKENDIINFATIKTSDEIKNQLNEDEQLSQIIDLISAHNLPTQILVKANSIATVDDIDYFINNLLINPQVEYVSYDKQWLIQLQAMTNALLQMARFSAVMFVLIIIVILGNTITNEITDHKRELRLLELMGATWAQVRRSFLYMGTLFGIYASLLSLIFLYFSLIWITDTIDSLLQNFSIEISLNGLSSIQILTVLIVSILVTWFAARMTLSTQLLNQVQD
jgi:cell division transport system permease protein